MTTINKKVCLLGDFAVGKTSLVRRFVYNMFDDKYISSIGVKVSRKTVQIPQANAFTSLTMMLWDLAGSERFDQVKSSYIRGTSGAILVCDLTRPETLANLHIYIEDLQYASPDARLIIAANKSDLVNEQQIALTEVEKITIRYEASYYLTSAKTGSGVENVFRHLARLLLE
ncbi:MAG: GTP-binding protein [Anaerolineae bacterium]|nr:GTP-binding protein [Anaerolineae bacterium]